MDREGQKETAEETTQMETEEGEKAEGKLTKQKRRWKRAVQKQLAIRKEKEGTEKEEEKEGEKEAESEGEEEKEKEEETGAEAEGEKEAESEGEEEEEKEEETGAEAEGETGAEAEGEKEPVAEEEDMESNSAIVVYQRNVLKDQLLLHFTESEEGNRDVEKHNVKRPNAKKNVIQQRTPREKRITEPSQFKKEPYTAEGKGKKKDKAGAEVGNKRVRKGKPKGRMIRQRTKK